MLEFDNSNNSTESDAVISSRVRLARNFKDYPFPYKINVQQSEKVLLDMKNIMSKSKPVFEAVSFIDVQRLNAIEKQALVEKHLISPDLLKSKVASGALISKDEKMSIMVNEEDHLRIQFFGKGLELNSLWKSCNDIDDIISSNKKIAFESNYGYLTSCPTNIGTGIRASAMLHLPALTMTGYINNVLEACGKFGMVVRGLFGENSEASGNMFQVSNQVTLGSTEEDIIASVNSVVLSIVGQESALRKKLYMQDPISFEDKVWRSMGILSNARIITTGECLRLLSDVRLGVNLGIIKDVRLNVLDEIMILIQPANLQIHFGKELKPEERDVKRAELIRSKINHN